MSRELRHKRNELCKESVRIRNAMIQDMNFDKKSKLKEKQRDIYKKWEFYNGFIKAQEKIK